MFQRRRMPFTLRHNLVNPSVPAATLFILPRVTPSHFFWGYSLPHCINRWTHLIFEPRSPDFRSCALFASLLFNPSCSRPLESQEGGVWESLSGWGPALPALCPPPHRSSPTFTNEASSPDFSGRFLKLNFKYHLTSISSYNHMSSRESPYGLLSSPEPTGPQADSWSVPHQATVRPSVAQQYQDPWTQSPPLPLTSWDPGHIDLLYPHFLNCKMEIIIPQFL